MKTLIPFLLTLAADAGGASGGGAATATGTEAAPKTKAKVEVEVNVKLAGLIKKLDEAAEKAGTYLVQVGELVAKDNISNAVLIKTIMSVRGNTIESARSQASRIRSLLKNNDAFEALKRGEVSVQAAIKSSQKKQASPVSRQKAFDSSLSKFIAAAKALGQDKRSIVATVEAALDQASVK